MVRNQRSESVESQLSKDYLPFDTDEECMFDDRVDRRPSEMVELKLFGVLPKGLPVPVSCIHSRRDVRR